MHAKCFLISLCLVWHVTADLKCASRPGGGQTPGYSIINENGAIPFVTKNIWHKYMEPSHYGYKGLFELRTWGRMRLNQEDVQVGEEGLIQDESKEEWPPGFGGSGAPIGRGGGPGGRGRGPGGGRGMGPPALPPKGQKYTNYDQFLRSNIDNEQDNRVFENEDGHDELPFRTNQSAVVESFTSDKYDLQKRWRKVGPIDLRQTIKPGESTLVPLRWNNPHAAEVEVNIWIFPEKLQPVVVPIRKPTCSGEGHQDLITRFTIPEDFTKLGAKIPGFKGCNADTKPMCTLQVYGHSVESRMYAFAWPLIIPGHDASLTTTKTDGIQPMTQDPGLDLGRLRDLCMPTVFKEAEITTAVPRWAKLHSDVYTHAYLNSDYSPYSGQQHEGISKNMQASCINKMWAANHGELGKSILPSATKERLDKLETLEERIYKRYESVANRLIKRIEQAGMMKSTGGVTAMGTTQRLANCFRCAHVGAVNPNRLNTNTYIPSFQLPKANVQASRRMIPPMFSNLINEKGQVQVYLAALKDLLPYLYAAQPYGIVYQTTVLKETLATKPDHTRFKKRDANGKVDGGVYAATMAKRLWAESFGCPWQCLYCNPQKCKNSWDNCYQPLINGAQATCIKDKCAKCVLLYGETLKGAAEAPPVTRLAASVADHGIDAGSAPYGVEPVDDTKSDVDGSPRIGRPAQPGEEPVEDVEEEHWDPNPPQRPAGSGAMIDLSMITTDHIEEEVISMSRSKKSSRTKRSSRRRRRSEQ